MAAETKAGEPYVLSDKRERYVHDFLDAAAAGAGIKHAPAHLTTGDYLICRRVGSEDPEILAVFERKTLKDFAASFKDNRYENRNKMLALRDRVGCQLYFVVEGPAYPAPGWKVARIPYSSILSAMTNLMVRDGIHVVQTKDPQHTAQRLVDFARAFAKTAVPYTYPTARKEEGAAPGEGEDAPEEEGAAGPRDGGGPAPHLLCPAAASEKIEKDDLRLVVEIWSRLPGVSVVVAGVLARSFTVAELVLGEVTAAELAALRTPTNRALPKKAAESLRAARSGAGWARATEVKLLSGVPGISPAMAADVLEGATLGGLLRREGPPLRDRKISQKGRQVRLGEQRAERVYRLLSLAPGRAAEAPAAEAPAPEREEAGAELDDETVNAILLGEL